MDHLDRDVLFVGLSRPQMLAGVTYGFAIGNAIVVTELFLLFRSPWVLPVGLVLHGAGMLACQRDARFFDVWLVRARHCRRIRNHRIWRCNSYRA